MSTEERRNIETSIRNRSIDVIVATSAFGMGMDLPQLRWALLWQVPPSLLALAQAVGRVGRAGVRGTACVFWDSEDFRLLDWTTGGSERRRQELFAIYQYFQKSTCRLQALNQYFEGDSGATQRPRCGRCDVCEKKTPDALQHRAFL